MLVLFSTLATALGALACGDASPAESSPPTAAGELEIGESRELSLRALRFEVTDFEQTLTLDELLELPEDVRRRLWLLDLPLAGGAGRPRLIDNALASIRDAEPESLAPDARALQSLLRMTPDNVDLRGTSFEELAELSPLVGLSTGSALARMLDIELDDTFIELDVAADAFIELIVATHPEAQQRLGARTPENPDGVYPVSDGAVPITLEDVATDFQTFAERLGPWDRDGVVHPGVVDGPVRAELLTDEFALRIRANANALPFRGVELRNAGEASVGSIASQIERLFDFRNPEWLTIEGLRPGEAQIDELTMSITQAPEFVRGGVSPEPRPEGSSQGWLLPRWMLEHKILTLGFRRFGGLNTSGAWEVAPDRDPLISFSIDNGWVEMETSGGVGSPPAPAYVWDLLLEVAQVRLRDGDPEEARRPIQLTLTDIPVGLDAESITDAIRENLEADPGSLLDVASLLFESTTGDADFYYVRTEDPAEPGASIDALIFVDERDYRLEADGSIATPRDYARPGFFADDALSEQASTIGLLPNHPGRHAVRIEPGARWYVEDAAARVYAIDALDLPSAGRLRLEVTRVR